MSVQIDKENVSNLTDDELFKTLKQCGINAGPITGTTRRIYERKLKTFLETGVLNNTTLNNTTLNNTTVNNTTVNTSKTTATRGSPRKKTSVQKDPILTPIENVTHSSSQESVTTTSKPPTRHTAVVEAPPAPTEVIAQPPPQPKAVKPKTPVDNVTHSTLTESIARASPVKPKEITPIASTHTTAPLIQLSNNLDSKIPTRMSNYGLLKPEESRPSFRSRTPETTNHIETNFTTFQSVTSTITTTKPSLAQSSRSVEASRAESSYQKPRPAPEVVTQSSLNPQYSDRLQSSMKPRESPREAVSSFMASTSSIGSTKNQSNTNITTTAPLSQLSNNSPIKDKFASRLNNYGLLRNDESMSAAPMSASSVRSRAPLHRDTEFSTPTLNTTVTKPAVLVHSTSVTSTTKVESALAKSQTSVNITYFAFVLVVTVIVYMFLMHMMNSNPENPIDI